MYILCIAAPSNQNERSPSTSRVTLLPKGILFNARHKRSYTIILSRNHALSYNITLDLTRALLVCHRGNDASTMRTHQQLWPVYNTLHRIIKINY
jgi:hypothetical protein